MINSKQTVKDIVSTYKETVDVFNSYGFKGLDNELLLNRVGDYRLEEILEKKNIDTDLFVNLLNETINNNTSDLTLQESNKQGKINVRGLLPCPVRIPLMETINKLNNIENYNLELKAASEGLDHLKESIKKASKEEELADIYISAGFDLFFEKDLMKKFKDKKVFDIISDFPSYNKDFVNDKIDVIDPNHDYSMISGVPAVFLINKKALGDKPMPRLWSDLFSDEYKGLISLPVSDFDLFNAILIHLYKEFGVESIKTLGSNLVASMHPAQMVKSATNNKLAQPAISIMPYFFSKMAVPGGVMEMVWPEDGAILSPIFMLTKKSKKEELMEFADLLTSKECGEILSHQGLFPSLHGEIDNNLGERKFKFVGWEYINNNDIATIIKISEDAFNEGMNL